MKNFETKFGVAFMSARKHREGLDAAVQSFKDKVAQLELSGRGLNEFRVYRKTNDSIGIRHDPDEKKGGRK